MFLCCYVVVMLAVPRKYLPPVMHHYRMGTSLVLIQLLLGSLLMAVALYLLIFMPVLNTRDVPHWSATTVSYHVFISLGIAYGNCNSSVISCRLIQSI